jgi:hypothetical protein
MSEPRHSAAGDGGHIAPPPGEKLHVFDRPENVRRLLLALYIVCGVLLVADFFLERHIYHPWERLPGFYPIYGWLSIVVLVLLAKQLRRIVMRDEDFYDAV